MHQRLNEFGDVIFDEHDEYGYLYFGRVSELGDAQVPARLIKLLTDSVSTLDVNKIIGSKLLTDTTNTTDVATLCAVNTSFVCGLTCVDVYKINLNKLFFDILASVDATKCSIYYSLQESVYAIGRYLRNLGINEFGEYLNATIDEFGHVYKDYISSFGEVGFYTKEPYVSVKIERSLTDSIALDDSYKPTVYKKFTEFIAYVDGLLSTLRVNFIEPNYITDNLRKAMPMFLIEIIGCSDTFIKMTSVFKNEYILLTESITKELQQRIRERLYLFEQYIKECGFDEFGSFLNTTIDEFGCIFNNYVSEVGSRGFFKRVPYVSVEVEKFIVDNNSASDNLHKEALVITEEGLDFTDTRTSALEKNIDESLMSNDELINAPSIYLQEGQSCADTLLNSNLIVILHDYILSTERLLKLHGAILKTRSMVAKALTRNLHNIWRLR